MSSKQLNYNEYKTKAGNTLRVYVERMEKIINRVGRPFDGIPVSVFAFEARDNERFTYPDDKKVDSLVRDMNTVWQGLVSRRPELKRFKLVFSLRQGQGVFLF